MSYETLDRELWGLGTKGQAKSACTSANGLVTKYKSTFEEVTSQRFRFSTGGPPPSCTSRATCNQSPFPVPSTPSLCCIISIPSPSSTAGGRSKGQRRPSYLPTGHRFGTRDVKIMNFYQCRHTEERVLQTLLI